MKIGITLSCFDMIHTDHLKMLEEAKNQCDHLIVGFQIDPSIDRPEKNKPVQSVLERFIQIKACKYIDEIVPYVSEQALLDILSAY